MSPPSIALHYSESKRNLVNNFSGFVSLELPYASASVGHASQMACIHLPDHIATIIAFLWSNSYVALVLKVLRVYTITKSRAGTMHSAQMPGMGGVVRKKYTKGVK